MAVLKRYQGLNDFLVSVKELEFKTKKNIRTNTIIHEVSNMLMEFENPTDKYILVDNRVNSITAQVVEMMMVLSGNPDLDVLDEFLPRAKQFSDDGKIWRGNYGTRIRGVDALCNNFYQDHPDIEDIKGDQLLYVYNRLKTDPSSRQGFITIGDSKIDMPINTLDTPCTMTLVFNIEENKLNMTTFMRSNDIVFGFSGVNYFIFTSLQELLASALGIEVGTYNHHAVSFHVYNDYRGQVDQWSYGDHSYLGDSKDAYVNKLKLFDKISIEQFDHIAEWFFMTLSDANELSFFYNRGRYEADVLNYLRNISIESSPLLAGLLFLPIYRKSNRNYTNTSHKLDDILKILEDYVRIEEGSPEHSLLEKIITRDKFLIKPTKNDWTKF